MATAATQLQIKGIQEALAELNKIDPRYRRQVTKDIKASGSKIISEARSMVANFDNSKGNGAPLSGMRRGSLIKGREVRWDNAKAQAGYKIKVGARATRERYVNFTRTDDLGNQYTEQVAFGALPYRLMVVQSVDPAAVIYDHAGRNTPNSLFVTNLNAQEGRQPRVIDPVVARNRPAVEADVLKTVKKVMDITNRNLKVRYGN
jgi:hypothetical protein